MKISKDKASAIKNLSLSILASILITFSVMFIMATLMHFMEIGREYSSPLSSIALGIGCFWGGFIHSKISGEKGLLCGIAVSGILFLLITIISLIISIKSFGLITLIHFIVMMLSGGIGGILGVNINKKIKI